MRPGARVQAAIEVLSDIEARRRPAADALKDWGLAHRFAGSGDRAAIAGLVYDALRHRASGAWRMGSEEPRALALAALVAGGATPATLDEMFADDRFAPAALSDDERRRLGTGLDGAPPWVRGDYPEWLHPSFERAFGEAAAEEGAALAGRAPLDLRTNALKADRDKVAKALARFGPAPTPFSPFGLRIRPVHGRAPAVQAEAAFRKGWFEVQDEGSQISALLTGVSPGEQVADICAGAGGKTLALAAAMGNTGQIYAYDADARRLAPIYDRLKRAGVRNAQVRSPGHVEALSDLAGRLDLVVVDAPCTGTGVWRRNPDAKWRVRPGALEERRRQQRKVLGSAAGLVKPGGRIAYITCSILPEENEDQVSEFMAAFPDYRVRAPDRIWAETLGNAMPDSVRAGSFVRLTPARTGTDGFFVALLEKGP